MQQARKSTIVELARADPSASAIIRSFHGHAEGGFIK